MGRSGAAPRATRVPDIRKGDEVLVLKGKDAGKRGTVERIVRRQQSMKKIMGKQGSAWQRRSPLAGLAVVVEGLNVAKRHTKPRPKGGRTDRQPRIQQGGILDIPQPIAVSNVMLVCPHCSRPTRVRHERTGDGRSIRTCTHCSETVTRAEAR
ncbi:MAG TPA: 50S ribosomal protein L24 [Anaerolineae bacterium]|nr:50S ribosomal protein L24 [Anaerolineae bacterium]